MLKLLVIALLTPFTGISALMFPTNTADGNFPERGVRCVGLSPIGKIDYTIEQREIDRVVKAIPAKDGGIAGTYPPYHDRYGHQMTIMLEVRYNRKTKAYTKHVLSLTAPVSLLSRCRCSLRLTRTSTAIVIG